MVFEYKELRRSELNTLEDMGGEKAGRVARDPHRRLGINSKIRLMLL